MTTNSRDSPLARRILQQLRRPRKEIRGQSIGFDTCSPHNPRGYSSHCGACAEEQSDRQAFRIRNASRTDNVTPWSLPRGNASTNSNDYFLSTRDAKTTAFIFCSNGVGLSRQLKNASKILPTVFPPRRGHLQLLTGIKDHQPQREQCPQRSCACQQHQADYAQLCIMSSKRTKVNRKNDKVCDGSTTNKNGQQ